MKVDDVVLNILKEVKAELHAEKGVELSIPEIGKIANSQLEAAIFGMKKGMDVQLPRICKFQRIYKKDLYTSKAEFNKLSKELGDEEKKALETRMKMERIDRMKKKRKAKSVKDIKNIINKDSYGKTPTIFDKLEGNV